MRSLIFVLVVAATACGNADSTVDAAPPPDAEVEPRPDATPLPACSNGIDDDGDYLIDLPWDPGCPTEEDDDETDPVPKPQCANGIDDDGDGNVDYPMDIGCLFAADDGEYNIAGGHCFGTQDLTTTGHATGEITASLPPNDIETALCTSAGRERVYTYTVSKPGQTLVVSTDFPATTLDTVIYVRTECRIDSTTLGCDDDGAGTTGGPSILTLTDVEVGFYFIIVDSFGPASLGAFELTVTAM